MYIYIYIRVCVREKEELLPVCSDIRRSLPSGFVIPDGECVDKGGIYILGD